MIAMKVEEFINTCVEHDYAWSKGEHGPWAILASLLALPAWFRQSAKPRSD